jgi:hypothetical protein
MKRPINLRSLFLLNTFTCLVSVFLIVCVLFILQNTKCKRTGGPLVMEAHKVYTPALFIKFCELKDESEFYRATLLGSGDRYMVQHYDIN